MIILIVGLICFLIGAACGGLFMWYNQRKHMSMLAKHVRLLFKANNEYRALKLLSAYELE